MVMNPNTSVYQYNGQFYEYNPTKILSSGTGSYGAGGTTRLLTPQEVQQGQYGSAPVAEIDPTAWASNASYTPDEIRQQLTQTFSGFDPTNKMGWQSNLDSLVSKAQNYLTQNPSLADKAFSNVWNDYRNSPAQTAPVWMINKSTGGLVQMAAADAKARMAQDPNLSLYGGGQVGVFNVNGNSYYYDPNSAEFAKNMATINRSAAKGTPGYDPNEPLKFGGYQTIGAQAWPTMDNNAVQVASGLQQLQAGTRPEYTSQEQANLAGMGLKAEPANNATISALGKVEPTTGMTYKLNLITGLMEKVPIAGTTSPTDLRSVISTTPQTGYIKAYDSNNGYAEVYVPKGKYVPGISLTKPDNTIPISSFNQTGSVQLPGTQPSVGSANALVSGGNTALQSLLAQLAPQESQAEKAQNDILGQIASLTGSLGNEGADKLAMEQQAGIADLKKKLSDINGQIQTKTAQYQALNTEIENKPISLNSIIGSQRAVANAAAADIGLLTAQAQALSGQISTAQQTVDNAISLKYSTIQAQLNTYKSQLDALQPILSKEEKARSQAQQLLLQEQQRMIDEAKSEEKNIQNLMLDAASKGASNTVLDKISKATSLTEAIKAYSQFANSQIAATTSAKVSSGTRSSGGSSGSQSDVQLIAQAIMDGDQPPSLTGLYGKSAAVKAELERKGYNLTRATADWNAMQKRLATLNGAQQVRLSQAVEFTMDSLGIIEQLNNQWKAGNFPVLNKAQLALAKNGVLGSEAQRIATQLDAQINDLVSELGTVYKGGNSSTDESLKLAAGNLKSDWSQSTLQSAINLARVNLQIRKNSIQNAGAIEGNQYSPEPVNQDMSSQIGTALSTTSVPENQQGFFSKTWNWLFGE